MKRFSQIWLKLRYDKKIHIFLYLRLPNSTKCRNLAKKVSKFSRDLQYFWKRLTKFFREKNIFNFNFCHIWVQFFFLFWGSFSPIWVSFDNSSQMCCQLNGKSFFGMMASDAT
jgi:hypothetical protein